MESIDNIPSLNSLDLSISNQKNINMMGGGVEAPKILDNYLTSKYNNVKRAYASKNSVIDLNTDKKIKDILKKQNDKTNELNNHIAKMRTTISEDEYKTMHNTYIQMRQDNDNNIMKISEIFDTMHNHITKNV